MVSALEKRCLEVFSDDVVNDRVLWLLAEDLTPSTLAKLMKFTGRHVSDYLREINGSDNSK